MLNVSLCFRFTLASTALLLFSSPNPAIIKWRIERRNEDIPNSNYTVLESNYNGNQYLDTGLSRLTTYSYRVVPGQSTGWLDASSARNATITTKDTCPTNVTCEHSGVYDTNDCECDCGNSLWLGDTCSGEYPLYL